jgi:polyketide biosynthesis acyl carrier protein
MKLMTDYGKETVNRVVRETISSILPNVPAETISGAKSLKDLGADSVDRVEIILSIMSRLSIDEPMSNFSSIPNIDALVEYLCRARQG